MLLHVKQHPSNGPGGAGCRGQWWHALDTRYLGPRQDHRRLEAGAHCHRLTSRPRVVTRDSKQPAETHTFGSCRVSTLSYHRAWRRRSSGTCGPSSKQRINLNRMRSRRASCTLSGAFFLLSLMKTATRLQSAGNKSAAAPQCDDTNFNVRICRMIYLKLQENFYLLICCSFCGRFGNCLSCKQRRIFR